MEKVLLSSAYFPNLHYFYYLLNSESVCIETQERYQKQSFRNRTQVLTANGVLDLVIPVRKTENMQIDRVEISYSEKWQRQHWRAISSAYKNSPYFGFFEDEIRMFYTDEFPLLFEYNSRQLETIMKLLRLKINLCFTEEYEALPEPMDLRNRIHPKISFKEDARAAGKLLIPYYQTFSEKFPFIPNLSVLDLLFNKGLDTLKLLKD